MGRYDLEYPKEPLNTVKREGHRGNYELEKIHGLINASQILHVSFNPPNSPFPAILPMIGQMGSFDRPSADTGDPLDLYLHGYVSSRIMNVGRSATGADGENKGMPVCVAASHVDGLVLALSAFSSSYNYRSAVLYGHATLVEDKDERLYAMELITNSVVPDRWSNARLPITGAELQSTSILKVKIASGSLKARVGSSNDEKADLEDEKAMGSIWTGVLPVHQVMEQPAPSSYNKVELPQYITEFTKDFNEENEKYCLDILKE